MTPSDDPTSTPSDDRRPASGADDPGAALVPGEPGYPVGSEEAPAIEAPLPAGKLKQRVIPDPPEMEQAQGRRAFLFVLSLVIVTAVVMAAVLALDVVADPYGSMGTHLLPTVTTSDRTVKADKIEQLEEPPQLVVLGSSRSMRYEPSYLEEKTGLKTFNAGVNGIGGTADAWAMTQFIHEVWPDADPAYLWMLDVESFVPFEVQARTANEPRLAKFVGQATVGKDPAELARAMWQNRTTLLSLDTAWDSVRLVLYRDKAKSMESRYRKQILDDGVLKEREWSEKEWKQRFPHSVNRYSNLYKNVYKKLDPEAEKYFEKTLAFMNDQGAVPVIALTPVNPKMRKVIGPLGWNARHKQVVDYVTSLKGTYDFVFIDLTDPSVFGFDPKQFYDGVHMTSVNTEKAIDHILKKSGGIPPAGAPEQGD